MIYYWEKYDYETKRSALPSKIDEGFVESRTDTTAKRDITTITETNGWYKWEAANSFGANVNPLTKWVKRKETFGPIGRELYYQYPHLIVYIEESYEN